MNWPYTPYTIPLLCSALISLSLAIYAWRNRATRGGGMLALLMLMVSIYALGYTAELLSLDLSSKLFWVRVELVGIVVLPVVWLLFILQHTGRERWLTHLLFLPLLAVPLLVLLLSWTNGLHEWVWSQARLDYSGPLPLLSVQPEFVFWVFAAFDALLFLWGGGLLLRDMLAPPPQRRGQSAALFIAVLAPALADLLSVFRLDLLLDLTPFAFTISGLALAWALFRFRLLDIVPVAHEAVVRSLGDGIIILDRENAILDLNAVAQWIIDRSAAEAVGLPLAQALRHLPELVAGYRQAAEESVEVSLGEGEMRRHYRLLAPPLFNRQGRSIGRIIVLHDVTEYKRSQRELRLAKEGAERANQAKSDFLASMSHELRTPLSAILGYSELLHEIAQEDGYDDFLPDLDRIHLAGRQLMALLNDILDLSKIEAGRVELLPETFPLAPLIDEVISTASPLMEKNGNTLYLVGEDLGSIYADRFKLRQILLNLLSNAAKFTQGGEVTLSVFHRADHGQGTIHFQVRDTGIGIAPEKLAGLFEPFVQAEATTSRRYGGSGLGLAISQRLCSMMSGDILVESVPGQGSTFTVWLPDKVGAAGAGTMGVRSDLLNSPTGENAP
ncbi:MAG: PAS domain-containing protein [Chloroflexia bacterium]|nr:PAS domain-containing protein [Chloroflexia bacterium]